jgi:hypothetical protein
MKYRTRRPTVPPYHWLYSTLQHSAKREGKPLYLTFENFLTFIKIQECYYCGAPIFWPKCSRYRDENGKLMRRSQAYYLDRKDNSHGYSLDNCVVCCPRCNAIKGNTLTYEEMLMLREGLRNISNRKFNLSGGKPFQKQNDTEYYESTENVYHCGPVGTPVQGYTRKTGMVVASPALSKT